MGIQEAKEGCLEVQSLIAPQLKKLGFKKRRFLFYKEINDFFLIIEASTDKYWGNGYHYSPVGAVTTRKSYSYEYDDNFKDIHRAECAEICRCIDDLVDDAPEFWVIDSKEDGQKVAKEISDLTIGFLVPFVEKLADEKEFITYLQGIRESGMVRSKFLHPHEVIISMIRGQDEYSDLCQQCLCQLAEDFHDEPDRDALNDRLGSIGLQLPDISDCQGKFEIFPAPPPREDPMELIKRVLSNPELTSQYKITIVEDD